MSDETKVNRFSGSQYKFQFPKIDYYNSLEIIDFRKFFSFAQENKVKNNDNISKSPTAVKLHRGWSEVMKAEAKDHKPFFKPDPNISESFFEELTNVAKRLNTNAEDLAAIIYRESHFDPQIKSIAPAGKYRGLIQMDEKTFNSICKSSGITFKQYSNLPREKQLKYTEMYLKYRIEKAGLTGKKLSGAQIYALIHKPAKVNNKSELNHCQAKINKAKAVFNKYSKHINQKC